MMRTFPLVMLMACAEGAPVTGTLITGVPTDAAWVLPEVSADVLEATTLSRDGESGALILWADVLAAEVGMAELELPAEADVAWLELPVPTLDPTEAAASEPWVTVVRVPTPWYATRGMVVSRFEALVEEYEAVEGLIRKDFLLTGDRQLGGVYRWTDPDAAGAFYDEAWHLDIEDRYGQPAWLEAWSAVDPDWGG